MRNLNVLTLAGLTEDVRKQLEDPDVKVLANAMFKV